MTETALLYLSLAAFIGTQTLRTASLVGGNIYDARLARRAHTQKRVKLTILVIVHDDATKAAQWLDDTFAVIGRKHIDVVMIDNASTDDTLRQLRRYKKRHPRRRLAVKSRRRYEAPEVLLKASARDVRGDIVLLLTPNMRITTQAITALQAENTSDIAPYALQLGRFTTPRADFTSVLQSCEAMEMQQWHKLLAAAGGSRKDYLSPGIACSKALLTQQPTNTTIKYLPQSVLLDQAYETPTQLLRQQTRLRDIPMLLMEIFPLTYFFYLAYIGTTATLFFLALVAYVVWVGLICMATPHLQSRHAMLLLLAPLMFVLRYILQLARFGCAFGLGLARMRKWTLEHTYPVVRAKTTGQ